MPHLTSWTTETRTQPFWSGATVVSLVLLVLLVVGLVALVRRMRARAHVVVLEEVRLPGPPDRVGPEVEAALRRLSGVEVTGVPGHTVVVVQRSVVPGLLLGLLLWWVLLLTVLDLVRGIEQRVDVRIFAGEHGETVVRLEGKTEKQVLERLRACLAQPQPAAVY